jgi:uncharacterized membrane protein YGL010W
LPQNFSALKKIFNFSSYKNFKEAIVFYLVSIGIIFALLIIIIKIFHITLDFRSGIAIGNMIAIMVVTAFTFKIFYDRKIDYGYKFFFFPLLIGFITALIGGIFGMMIVAYLTTRPIDRREIKSNRELP